MANLGLPVRELDVTVELDPVPAPVTADMVVAAMHVASVHAPLPLP